MADARSTDTTVAVAVARGAWVVAGGQPAVGRNNGARAASGELLLFLDADVLPRPLFVGNALAEFDRLGYAVATCLITPLGDDFTDRILVEITNLYLQVVQYVSPHAPGCCILARRAVHEAIGGFDEDLKLGEDHDYAQRAGRHGPFGILTSARIPVSMRRLEQEGVTRLALKYLWCEMHALAGKPIRSLPFDYRFGSFALAAGCEEGPEPGDSGWSCALDGLDNPVNSLSSAALAVLEGLVHDDSPVAAGERIRLRLDPSDRVTLQHYLRRRRALLRIARWKAGRRWSRLQAPVSGGIRRLDRAWVRERWAEARRARSTVGDT